VTIYQRMLRDLLADLGDDPARYTAARLRAFVLARGSDARRAWTRLLVTATRTLLRYLGSVGRCPAGLEAAVPSVAAWRLASLPRALAPAQVDRVLAACDRATAQGLRDYAILLLLVRLGLRAGDVAALHVAHLDWPSGSLRLCGKGRRETRLPLPQDVGDALVAYLERGRPAHADPHVFLAIRAPHRPTSAHVVSNTVRDALRRAGVVGTGRTGAHVLRHTAATAMLRGGATLETIATVLRHRSPQTTAIYAKVDVPRLARLAQPWPAEAPC
jgi:integrase